MHVGRRRPGVAIVARPLSDRSRLALAAACVVTVAGALGWLGSAVQSPSAPAQAAVGDDLARLLRAPDRLAVTLGADSRNDSLFAGRYLLLGGVAVALLLSIRQERIFWHGRWRHHVAVG